MTRTCARGGALGALAVLLVACGGPEPAPEREPDPVGQQDAAPGDAPPRPHDLPPLGSARPKLAPDEAASRDAPAR